MRTARLLTISQDALPEGCICLGWVYLLGVYLLGGCTCPGGVPAGRVYLPGGCTCWGVDLLEGWPAGGVPAWGVPAQVLPPVNRMTDRCKNITLPQTSFAGVKKLLLILVRTGIPRVRPPFRFTTLNVMVLSQLHFYLYLVYTLNIAHFGTQR